MVLFGGGQADPPEGFGVVLFHAATFRVQHAEPVLRVGVALGRRPSETTEGLRIVLLQAPAAILVPCAELGPRRRVPLLGQQAVRAGGAGGGRRAGVPGGQDDLERANTDYRPLDAATGEPLWNWHPGDNERRWGDIIEPVARSAGRGVTYWTDGRATSASSW